MVRLTLLMLTYISAWHLLHGNDNNNILSLDSLISPDSCFPPETVKQYQENITEIITASMTDAYRLPQCGSGLWHQLINLDMSNSSHSCPVGWHLSTNPRSCSRGSQECAHATLAVSRNYRKVCGRALGFGKGSTDGFFSFSRESGVTNNYVDGLKIYASSSNFIYENHIWTFASNEIFYDCPCDESIQVDSSAYVGNNYFCDIGPKLWTESDCVEQSECCNFNNPPWFSTSLRVESSRDIIMSICCDEDVTNEDVLIQELVIYIQ